MFISTSILRKLLTRPRTTTCSAVSAGSAVRPLQIRVERAVEPVSLTYRMGKTAMNPLLTPS